MAGICRRIWNTWAAKRKWATDHHFRHVPLSAWLRPQEERLLREVLQQQQQLIQRAVATIPKEDPALEDCLDKSCFAMQLAQSVIQRLESALCVPSRDVVEVPDYAIRLIGDSLQASQLILNAARTGLNDPQMPHKS